MSFLTVLLTILKIIGIVIGGIIGVILLLLLWILLSPVRYKGRIKYVGKPDISIKVSYLCHIVSAFFILDDEGSRFDFKIFGKSMIKKKSLPSRKKPKKSSSKQKHHKGAGSEPPDGKTADIEPEKSETADNAVNPAMTENAARLLEKKQAQPDAKPQTPQTEPNEDKKGKKNKKSIFKRLKDIYNGLKAKIAAFRRNAEKLIEKRDRLWEEIENTDNREAVSFILVLLKKFLKHILPRKHKIYIRFGAGDPAKTGEFLGLMYAFAALMGLNLEVEPDFENKVIECDVPFKGHISIVVVAIWVLKAYRHDKLNKLIEKIKNR